MKHNLVLLWVLVAVLLSKRWSYALCACTVNWVIFAHLMVCPYVCLVVLTTRRELEMESETTLLVNPINAFLNSFLSNPIKVLSNSQKSREMDVTFLIGLLI